MARTAIVSWTTKHSKDLLIGATLFAGLYLLSLQSYLLVHSIAEGFSVVVGFSIFLFAWNSRRFFKTDYFVFLSTAYLAAASLDFVHTLAFPGMGVFGGENMNLAPQLWLAARFTQGIALLAGPIVLQRRLNPGLAVAGFGAAVGLWIAVIFSGRMPAAYVEGEGLTAFKTGSEYLIMLILVGAVITHYRAREVFAPNIFWLLMTSILLTIVSELMFTLYLNVDDTFNLIGHFLKIVAFFLIYKAVLQTGLVRPFDVLFQDLEEAQRRYRQYFRNTLNPLAIFQVEREGGALYFLFFDGNQALATLLELDLTKSIGKPVTELSPAFDGPALFDLFEAVYTKGHPLRVDHASPDGQRCFRIAIFSAGSNQVGMFVEDITERKRAETILQESEARLRTVLENMPVLLFAIDEQGRIITWNRECERVSGYSEAEVLSDPAALEKLFPDAARRQQLVARAPNGRAPVRELEVSLACKAGPPRRIAWSSVAGQFPVVGWTDWLVGVDVTERQRVEVLEREQRQLAEALRDVANALNSALDLPEVFDRVLNSLDHVIPHDLAAILLIDPDTDTARVVGSHSEDPAIQAALENRTLPIKSTAYLHTMMTARKTLIVPDTLTETGLRVTHVDWRSFLGVPIVLEDRVIGFIELGSVQTNFFSADHAARLEAFAEQVAIAIYNARLVERERALVAAQERERLARDLHDAVSQTLFSASMIAEALPRQWQRNPEKALDQLAELHHLTRGAMAEMRVLLLELRPTSLLEVDLPALLRQLVEAIRSRKRMVIQLEIDGEFDLVPDIKLALYRITQEALNNIAKHADASAATIQLVRSPQGIGLTITDNGVGFNLDEVQATSLGLAIMRERSEEIGAVLTITSQPGNGTCVKLFVDGAVVAAAARKPDWSGVQRSDARDGEPDIVRADPASRSAPQEKHER
mgnify:CR=1 FL=1